ncbi:MAG: transposase [Gammaproteobacteria bacterium]|nr:transposase [Gammaproteobacteria bacterium]
MSYNDLRKGRFSESGREYLITAVTHQRTTIFNNFHCARLLIKTLRESEHHHDCQWLCWVIMPDHFHGLLRLNNSPPNDLSNVMKFIKGQSAKTINHHLKRSGSLWQTGFHDHALRQQEDSVNIARYIVANPLRARLVKRLADWPHWDSVWLK